MSQVVLDAGAFIAFEKGNVRLRARLAAAHRLGLHLTTSAPVVGQVWRDGRKQALVARLLAAVDVRAPDDLGARRAGELLAKAKTSDVVDALLTLCARDGDTVITSDPGDIRRLLAAAGINAMVVAV